MPATEDDIQAVTEQFLGHLCAPVVKHHHYPVAIICAHPDDETIGAGSRLPRLRNVAVLHVTDGAPDAMDDAWRNGFSSREEYSAARRNELEAALALAGVERHQLYECGIPDQRATLMLTAATRAVLDFLERFRPAIVVTHPYEGGHPDHDATAFAVHAACTLVHRDKGTRPAIIEMTSYHNQNGSLATGDFLESTSASRSAIAWLTPDECKLKREMFACFRTQAPVLSQFPIHAERFRGAPRYDFARAPHTGKLFYELHPWGITGENFRMRVADTLRELGLMESTL